MKTVYNAANLLEAQMLLDLLRQEGIHADIKATLEQARGMARSAGRRLAMRCGANSIVAPFAANADESVVVQTCLGGRS